MAVSIGIEAPARVLGLGNDILADDAFGILVAEEVGRVYGRACEVVCSSASGFHLMDHLVGALRLLVVDTILSGESRPGTIHIFTEDQMRPGPGGSPHFLGLFDVLAVARELNLSVPSEIVIIGVEASDCTTLGGTMHSDVKAAIPAVVELAGQFLGTGRGG